MADRGHTEWLSSSAWDFRCVFCKCGVSDEETLAWIWAFKQGLQIVLHPPLHMTCSTEGWKGRRVEGRRKDALHQRARTGVSVAISRSKFAVLGKVLATTCSCESFSTTSLCDLGPQDGLQAVHDTAHPSDHQESRWLV